MTQSDQCEWSRLLEAARQGSESALGEVFERVRQYLLLAADRGLSGNLRAKLGASDIVQQTMLEGQQNLDQFAGSSEEELRAWLIRIVEHNLIDWARHYRQTQRRDLSREVPLSSIDYCTLAGVNTTASSIIQLRERDDELLRAIARLSEKRRRIIELRHQNGLSYAEIADQLGMTEVAARKLWSRSIESLRQELAAANEPR